MTRVVPFEAQLPEKYGGVNCTAVATARAIDWATQGKTQVTGAMVRAQTNEPIPDPASPGLNLVQVAAAARHWSVFLDVRIGSRSVPWAEYERRRKAGQGAILQVNYAPIADSPYDAGGGFRGGHAIFEYLPSTLDSLADGRRAGIWKYDGRLYPRSVIQSAAYQLTIAVVNGRPVHPLPGTVWAAFTLDVIPDYWASVRPLPGQKVRVFANYEVVNGVALPQPASFTDHTTGFGAPCTPPQPIRMPGGGSRYLVQLTDGSRKDRWIAAGWAKEV